MKRARVTIRINGVEHAGDVDARTLLADFIREHAGLKGTHLGCEHGVCGACTVLLDGEAVRACLLFAVQADGADVSTVEGLLRGPDGGLHPLQRAFHEEHGLQCGFCTPGFIVTLEAFIRDAGDAEVASHERIREALAGNLCRCTGYQSIVEAASLAARELRALELDGPARASGDTAEPEGA